MTTPRVFAAAMLANLAACASPVSAPPIDAATTDAHAVDAAAAPRPGACSPVDGELRVNHLQMLGTHNSYHVAKQPPISKLWDYTHDPLTVQLDQQGVRAFELDLHHRGGAAPIEVEHVPQLDDGTSCETLAACLQQLKAWSDAHPCHHPLVVTMENKDDLNESQIVDHLPQLEQEVLAVWPRGRLVTPDDLRGGAADLKTALAQQGWPTLQATRGKLLVVLYDKQGLGARYRQLHPQMKDAVAFVFGDPADADTAAVLRDDPTDPQIGPLVQAGYLVRTFPSPTAAESTAAVQSGATVVSTDHPVPKPRQPGFALQLPGGQPSRCNPLTAPPSCSAAAVNAGVGSAVP
jgi:hypothetical protein